MARDGCSRYAKLLAEKIVALLNATLKEKEAADKKLTPISKEVNAAALNGSNGRSNQLSVGRQPAGMAGDTAPWQQRRLRLAHLQSRAGAEAAAID